MKLKTESIVEPLRSIKMSAEPLRKSHGTQGFRGTPVENHWLISSIQFLTRSQICRLTGFRLKITVNLLGKYDMKVLSCSKASMSFSNDLWATPEIVVCVLAPPNSSWVTVSPVTVWKEKQENSVRTNPGRSQCLKPWYRSKSRSIPAPTCQYHLKKRRS